METTAYLEAPVGDGWEAWVSSDDRGWIVEFVRFTNPACVLLASRPRPLGTTVFPDPPIALQAVRAMLFDYAERSAHRAHGALRRYRRPDRAPRARS